MNVQKSFQDAQPKRGILYLVATPIGNLEDMTFRAIRILKEVRCIAAEDTRQTRKLLNHFHISARLVSYHEYNKQASGPELIRMLLEGESIALVSDAGMPAISDPGYELVNLAIESEIAVVPIPGANAGLSALIVSGLPTERFLFNGFLPREKKKRTAALNKLKQVEETLIFYEAPHRVERTLEAMLQVWGDRSVALARELTKKYEEIIRAKLSECLAQLKDYPPQGEYCIIVQGRIIEEAGEEPTWWNTLTVEEHVEHYINQCGDRKEAMKLAAADRKVSKREIYNQLLK